LLVLLVGPADRRRARQFPAQIGGGAGVSTPGDLNRLFTT
jgi:hypothetical protein